MERNDPDSPCYVLLDIRDAEKKSISHGIHASPTEAMYHLLEVLRSPITAVQSQVDQRKEMRWNWQPSSLPPHECILQCFPVRNRRLLGSGRFNRAQLERILPSLGDQADWSGKEIAQFAMERPKRKNCNGKRYPKRDKIIVLNVEQIQRRLQARWYYQKPLRLMIKK